MIVAGWFILLWNLGDHLALVPNKQFFNKNDLKYHTVHIMKTYDRLYAFNEAYAARDVSHNNYSVERQEEEKFGKLDWHWENGWHAFGIIVFVIAALVVFYHSTLDRTVGCTTDKSNEIHKLQNRF